MIKINLLPQRKPKRTSEPGQRDLAIGVLGLLGAGVAVALLFHVPQMKERDDKQQANAEFAASQNARRKKIAQLEDVRAAVASAKEKTEQIEKLIAARAVPAHMLHELGEILTPGRQPTMTKEISGKVAKGDDIYQFRDDWDPRHVWITEFVENRGTFKLIGGAESDADVTQLSKRMQASAHFEDVAPAGGEKVTDKDTGITYYSFEITGKVVY